MTSVGRVSSGVTLALALMLAAPVALAQAPTDPAGAPAAPPAPVAPPPPAPDATPPETAVPAPTPPAATPTSAAIATTPDEDAAKLAEILGQENAGAAAEPSLRFYGFADFNTFQYVDLSPNWKNLIPEELSFYVGKLNLYMEGNIAPDWKSLIEVRYMFIPNGAAVSALSNPPVDPITNPGRFNGVASDYTDSDRPIAWGGVSIQRAYLEHNFTNFLSVRAGRFLTPWGIWNVDHGSPVIIGPSKPYIIGDGFFPQAQTGFDAFGSVPVGDSATLGYHLTLSNGRGPTEATRDGDSNKAIGGRLLLKAYVLGQINVGISGYGGTVTDKRQQIDLAARGLVNFQYEHYQELSWAADVQWTWRGLHFQTEAAIQDRVWDNNARPASGAGVQPDVRRFGLYGLLGYRLPWFNVMPYAIFQYYDTGWRGGLGGLASKVTAFSIGVNVRLTPSVVFKAEYSRAFFGNTVSGSPFEDPLSAVACQLAWAF